MTQQFIALRERNDPLKELIGKSYNEKTKHEAERILKEIHSISSARTLNKSALCYATRDGEIKGLGGSSLLEDKLTGEIQSNLILDNFGQWLSGMFKLQSGSSLTRTLIDTGGAGRLVQPYGNGAQFNFTPGSAPGMFLQVGSGSTAPARTDFNIETALITAPEITVFELSSNSVYNNSTFIIKSQGNITAGGSGTINESMMAGFWEDTGSTNRTIALFHDIISPGVPFISGDAIILEYQVQV